MSSKTESDPRKTATSLNARRPAARGERLAKVGTVVSAILATSCCWGPLLLLLLGMLGVSTAGFSRVMRAGLETYRPLFMIVTFGFLGMALYLTFRPRRAPAAGAAEDC